MLEALFVVVFTTIIMFVFLQVCIMVVDDMTANEAVFAGMRSAAVTKKSERAKEAEAWTKNYLRLYYYSLNPLANPENPIGAGSFKYSKKEDVVRGLKRQSGGGNNDDSEGYGEEQIPSQDGNDDSKAVTIYDNTRDGRPKYKDYSGRNTLEASTVKLYYYTRVMFGSLFGAPRDWGDKMFGLRGSKRYQSARSRMMPSPDSDFYETAYRGSGENGKFKDHTAEVATAVGIILARSSF